MIRKIAFTALTALALLGLAIPGCTTPPEGGGGGGEQATAAAVDPSHKVPAEAHVAQENGAHGGDQGADRVGHDADGGGHGSESAEGGGHGAHGRGQGHGGPGNDHGPAMGGHGSGDQRQERAERRLGEEVRDFTVTDNTGKTFRLGTLRRTKEGTGKIAVLTFWCTTCHSCRDIERGFDEKAKEYQGQGVLFLAVDSNFTDNPKRVNRFLEAKELSFPVLMDSESGIARYFGAKWTTTTAVIDADGRLRYYGGFAAAEAAVRNLMAGEEVAIPESPGGG
jgi:peroxiredoxin